ncbi:MAG: hypothetical protein KGJ60_06570 [Verrucomicrobiota bacterium]|nr:hypothetical protein [Verrucomicrobiota bacterium]
MKFRAAVPCLFRLVLLAVGTGAGLESGVGLAGQTGTAATGLTFSEYNSKDLSQIAQVHAARVFVDYEHWGFFRIGLLPVLVAENVQIKIQSAEGLTNTLADLMSWPRPAAEVRQLELRRLEITLFGEKQPRLCAASAWVGAGGVLELSAVSARVRGEPPISVPRAALQVSGPSAGRLSWNQDGRREAFPLFKLTANKTP